MNTYGPMYLFMDTETGGLDCNKHSLLSAGFILTDEVGNVIDKLHILCAPDDGDVVVNSGALEVNKIDVKEHLKKASSYTKAEYQLLCFLNKHKVDKNNTTRVGHNLSFDLGFLWNITKDLQGYFNRRNEDTAITAKFLRIPYKNLSNLAELLEVDISDLTAHTALDDAEITRRVYFKMFSKVFGDVNGKTN